MNSFTGHLIIDFTAFIQLTCFGGPSQLLLYVQYKIPDNLTYLPKYTIYTVGDLPDITEESTVQTTDQVDSLNPTVASMIILLLFYSIGGYR